MELKRSGTPLGVNNPIVKELLKTTLNMNGQPLRDRSQCSLKRVEEPGIIKTHFMDSVSIGSRENRNQDHQLNNP